MSSKEMRKITAKANRKAEKEMHKKVKPIIRTLKADVKKTAKKGISDLRVKIKDAETYKRAKQYFMSKGFRCWEYTYDNSKYLAIEW